MSKLKKLIIFDLVTFFLSLIFGLFTIIFQEVFFIAYLFILMSTLCLMLVTVGVIFILIEIISW